MVAFKGGTALEKRLSELAAKVTKPANLSVGFLENSTYPDGTSVPMVAAILEFGAPGAGQRTIKGRASAHGRAAVAAVLGQDAGVGIPPRPYFRNMVAAKSGTWGDAIANLLTANDYDATKTMNQVGAGIKGQLQQSIVDTNAPPLSPRTVAQKGFEKPLVDTGHLLASVDFKVE